MMDILETLEQEEIDFEMNFFRYIAGSSDFEIIPVPTPEGFYTSEEEKQYIINQAKQGKLKLLFRIEKCDNTAVVFDLFGSKVAVIPASEENSQGFLC